ncbi:MULTISPECIES: YeiH family protein [Clostridium]|uniref:Sulfate exporter family transporter n=1 Tax=Clostridium brassicae TaxID=2999072 RepID=A0ABT4D9Z2_9CLOT|nr:MULTISPECIES: putative sulfate exporter family transporter [Clostridium]MCY6959125.1 putative sulfate exporter family transporter [Clostridium brassicae]WMJ79124.1 putative sulfate exporter family transporter [Clostridium sp. MB40-C1]
MDKIKKMVPGIIFVLIISILSMFINDAMKNIINLEALTIGIIIGIVYNNTIRTQSVFKEGVSFSLKKLLKVGIVLLGFKLNFNSLLKLGPKVLIMVLIFVPSVLILSILLGKIFKTEGKLAPLIGVGSCICGASAVVALAPTINADDEDSVVAVSIVSFLGAIGVLIYSALAVTSNMTDLQYGVWSGISLHGVAHAIAAAFARGDVSGEIGTFVKMARVVMLVPVSIALGLAYNKDSETSKKAKFPMYVLYFIIAGAISSTGIIPDNILKVLTKLSNLFILMAMVGMGLSVDFKSIRDKGMKALLIGSIIFLITSVSTYFIVNIIV